MADITYCVNEKCPFTDCKRHLINLKSQDGMVSFAALDGVCRRYISHLMEVTDLGVVDDE